MDPNLLTFLDREFDSFSGTLHSLKNKITELSCIDRSELQFPSQVKKKRIQIWAQKYFFLQVPLHPYLWTDSYGVESVSKPPVCPPYFDYTPLYFRVKYKLLAPVTFHLILGEGKATLPQ